MDEAKFEKAKALKEKKEKLMFLSVDLSDTKDISEIRFLKAGLVKSIPKDIAKDFAAGLKDIVDKKIKECDKEFKSL